MSTTVRFVNGRVLLNHQLRKEDLWISGGKVCDPQREADLVIDAKGMVIAPGFIDVQINGAVGIDITSNPGEVDKVASFLPATGVTSFLPTVVSSLPEHYRRCLPLLQPRPGGKQGAEILGIHLEGPFFSHDRIGAHSKGAIRSCDEGWARAVECYGSLDGVRLVTLAPEVPGVIQLIRELTNEGIAVALGHSQASFNQCEEAIAAGTSLITHLFNAMGFHHRDPSLVGAALTDARVYYSVIADGIHLHPAVVDLAWRARPQGLVLVTDAMAGLGLPPGHYRLGSHEVEVDDQRVVLAGTETLAGSVLRMDVAVRNLRQATGCSVVEALEAASLVPAMALRLNSRKGTLDVGADADIVLLDDELRVVKCWIAGEEFEGKEVKS